MNRVLTLAALSTFSLAIALAADSAQDHRDWMDDAGDQKDQLKEQLDAKSAAKAAPFADKLVELITREQKYWVTAKVPEAVKLADETLTLAKQLGAAVKAGKLDDANKVYAALGVTCSACHDMHPETKIK